MSADFTCAICLRKVDMRWERPWRKDCNIAPICRSCEVWYSRGIGKPTAGSFMDRRNVARGLALAEALKSEAGRQTWSIQHG